MKTKSALSYFGSDSEVASQLAALINDRKHCTILFAGGLSILPHLTARGVVANDLNSLAINFYRCLAGLYGEFDRQYLINRCKQTLSHPEELDTATGYLTTLFDHTSPREKAWAYWAMCWIGRKGSGGCKRAGGLPSVRWTAQGGNNATRIQAAAGDLEAWAEHFKRCEFVSMDFRDVLAKVKDDPDCSIYCDPPFYGAGDAYLHSFTEQDHVDLRGMLRRFECTKVLVRYGDDPRVRELYSDWRIIDAESRTQANSVKGELWITNWED